MHLEVRDWITMVIAFIGGTGWWQFLLQRRKARQERHRDLLEKFLLPLDSLLRANKKKYEALQKDRDLVGLEYRPEVLKKFFDSLPDSDQRKTFWRVEIDTLQGENQKIVALLEAYIGSTALSPAFKETAENMKRHMLDWRAMWNYSLNNIPMPGDDGERLIAFIAEPFDARVERELSRQIDQTCKLAGVRNEIRDNSY